MTVKNILNSPERMKFIESCIPTLSIMPLVGVSKKPKEKGWQEYSTNKRPARLDEFTNCNSGIITGPASNLLVLDIDNPDLFFSWLKRQNLEIPETYTVTTGKGEHRYFPYPGTGKIYGNKSIPTAGIDIRGSGGYVVAPFSVHQETGKTYQITDPRALAPAPDWLLYFYHRGVPPELTNRDINKLQLPENIMQKIKEPTLVGMRSDNIWDVLIGLILKGFSDEQIYRVLYEYPIGQKFIEVGQNRDSWMQPQIDKARTRVKEAQKEEKIIRIRKSISIVWGPEFKDREYDTTPLIDNLLEPKGSLQIIGPPGAFKSTLSRQIAMTVGNPPPGGLFGKFEIPNALTTVIIQSENTAPNVWSQIKAICNCDKNLELGLKKVAFPEFNNEFRCTCIDFRAPEFKDYMEQIKEMTQATLVIFDPLISFAGASSENDNLEMRKSLDIQIEVCDELGLASINVHHTGKSIHEGVYVGRGASSIADAASNIISLKPEKIQDKIFTKAANEKSRTFESFGHFYLARNKNHILVPVDPKGVVKDQDVLKVIRKNKGQFDSKTAFKTALKEALNLADRTAYDAIDHAVSSGHIIEAPGKGNCLVYRIK